MGDQVINILAANEAELLVQALEVVPLSEIGSPRWWNIHEYSEKLNMQAVINVSTNTDEFIKDFLVSHEKVSVLICNLITTEVWKEYVFPQLLKNESLLPSTLPIYMVLFHEATVTGLLETTMFHQEVCEAAGDFILDLVDFCYRKLYRLIITFKSDNTYQESRGTGQELKQQDEDIMFTVAMKSLSILRYILEAIEVLPVCASTRILNTHDIPSLLIEVLEIKPWMRSCQNGKKQKFVDGKWKDLVAEEYHILTKTEGQVWLCLYQLLLHPECQRKYQFNSYRKERVLKLRRYLNEVVLDQIPNLVELQRFMEQLSLAEPPPTRSELVFEQIPEIRAQLEKKFSGKWNAVADQQMKFFNLSIKDAKEQATRLAGTYNLNVLETLLDEIPKCASCLLEAMKRCSRCQNEWYCSRQCQVKHWSKHKSICDLLAASKAL